MDFKSLHEVVIFIYGLAIVGYFIDFIQQNRRANQIAFWSLSMVWLLQTFFLLSKLLSDESFPFLTIYDGLYIYAWILITFSLIINRIFRMDFFAFFTNILGFIIMMLHLFTKAQESMTSTSVQFVGEVLVIHITLALISYGFFAISFICSLMYLLQYRLLKRKRWTFQLKRLGNLEQLDMLSYISVLIGVPMLMVSIILGLLWGYTTNALFYWDDVKTIGSFVVLIVYIIFLFLRVGKGLQGRTIAYFNVYAFLFMLVNYFLFSSLSNFHF
ncbi:cytochrome C assembly family protein [Salirhabdus salicampi]|uniref:cytochrome C assembly family protein n=1 Tax=Salirhabdus salicampi TaxID=476102 RepID=UPI0020C42897|nr:cytochrome c biogenesis protein CcsA [Salirhabdus salicampi]MCP8617027.1 cytochrome c biogenesis protein [Salirhabdus salicampi]